ncbi:MFS transporter [Streptomyces sp. NPDC001388]|uniref:MFS transporter n=1 Tax=Streptomyces sp. NPDC001388 TaxID=3364568 RepID=UPI00367482D7
MSPAHPTPPGTGEVDGRRANLVVAVLAFGGIVVPLPQTLVIPIVPELPELLDASASDAAWAVTATLFAAAVAAPVMGRLGDMYGKRRMLLVGLVALVAGSVTAALSDTLAPMLVGRALQGLAFGVVPLGIGIMRDELPTGRLGSATALMSASLGAGGALGLPAAALVVDHFDWHALFWTSAALGVLATVLVTLTVPESAVRGGGRFDVVGALGLAAGLVCLLLGMSKGGDWGWRSTTTLGLFAAAIVVLLLWGLFELRVGEPLVDLRTSAHRQVLVTNLASTALGFSVFVMSLVLPQLLQLPEATGYGLGRSLPSTGLLLAPTGLVMMATAPVSALLSRARGPKLTLMLGAVTMAAGYGLGIVLMDAVWELVLVSCVIGAGTGFAYGAMPALVMGAVDSAETAAANSLNTLMRSIGTSTATAVAGVILARTTTPFGAAVLPSENGFKVVMAVGSGAAVLALLAAAFIPRQETTDGAGLAEGAEGAGEAAREAAREAALSAGADARAVAGGDEWAAVGAEARAPVGVGERAAVGGDEWTGVGAEARALVGVGERAAVGVDERAAVGTGMGTVAVGSGASAVAVGPDERVVVGAVQRRAGQEGRAAGAGRGERASGAGSDGWGASGPGERGLVGMGQRAGAWADGRRVGAGAEQRGVTGSEERGVVGVDERAGISADGRGVGAGAGAEEQGVTGWGPAGPGGLGARGVGAGADAPAAGAGADRLAAGAGVDERAVGAAVAVPLARAVAELVAAVPGLADGEPGGGGRPVRGQVRGAESAPVAGAAVTLISLGGRQLGRAVTGPDGSYAVEAPGEGTYVLIIAADGHQPQATTVVVGATPVTYDVLLVGGSGLAGVVRSAGGGAPVAAAVVVVTDVRGDVLASVRTCARGEFAVTDLAPGPVTVAVGSPGHRPVALPVEIGATGVTRIAVELRPGARVRGRVRGAGAPLGDARVTLVDTAGNVVASTTTGADGAYAFADLDGGQYTVIATGYPPRATGISLAGGDVDDHDIELTHAGG